MKSYHYCDAAKLIISNASTLGYEALARGSKVIFFNYHDFDSFQQYRKIFCWPYRLKKNGPFWTNDISLKNCSKNNFIHIFIKQQRMEKNLYKGI